MSQLSELKGLEKENAQLKKVVAELELDKLILQESLDFFAENHEFCGSVIRRQDYSPGLNSTRHTASIHKESAQ